MTSQFIESTENASIFAKNNIVVEVNDKFLQMIGYSYCDIVGRSLKELSLLLKMNFQMCFDDIKDVENLYIFNSEDVPKDITITYESQINENEKLYYIEENINTTLQDLLLNFGNSDINGEEGQAIYSYPALICLKSNKKYIDALDLMNIKYDSLIGLHHPSPKHLSRIIEMKSFHENEVEHIGSNGITSYWDVSIRLIHGNTNKMFILSSLYDVTDRVMPNLEINRTLKMQDEMFVNISHELKTPLNLIFSSSQLLNMYLEKDSLINTKKNILYSNNIIMQNCYRLTKLINNILDISKIESGFYELNLRNLNIVDVIDNMVDSVSEYIKASGLEIKFNTKVEKLVTAFDIYKLERILLNLISNAIKFSDSTGVILVSLVESNGYVEISVEDNGIGMEEEYKNVIFDKYRQVNTSLNPRSEGNGIGLFLVKSIVELHGGKINVESTLGKGSIFTVTLPMITVDSESIEEIQCYDKDKIEVIKFELSDIYS